MPTDDETFAQQRQMAVTRMLRPRAFSHTTYVDGAYGSYDPGEGGEAAPDWVPADAKIHIDFVGGTPQGRAWTEADGEVDIDTLLGNDPVADAAYSATDYLSADLATDGLAPTTLVAFIGSAKARVMAGATVRMASKRNDLEIDSGTILMQVSAGGDYGVSMVMKNFDDMIEVSTYWSVVDFEADVVVNTTGATNVVAYTITSARAEVAGNGNVNACAIPLEGEGFPPGDPMVCALFDFRQDYAYVQSITLYDPLPSTAGLSELSEL